MESQQQAFSSDKVSARMKDSARMKYSHEVLDQALKVPRARKESDSSKQMSAARSFVPGEKAGRDEPKLDRILNNLAARAMEDTRASTVAIGLEREGAMICRAVAGLPLADPGASINTESGLTGMAVRLQMSQWCTDTQSDARVDAEVCRRFGLRSIIVVPVRSGDTVIGIFAIFSEHPDAFSLGDLNTVKKLSHWAAEAVETTRIATSQAAAPPTAGPDYSGESQLFGGFSEHADTGGSTSYIARGKRSIVVALNALVSILRRRSVSPSTPRGPSSRRA